MQEDVTTTAVLEPSSSSSVLPQEYTLEPTSHSDNQIQNENENPPSQQYQSSYANMYDGLVYHKMYDHLVTVDLQIKLYLRTNGNKRNRNRNQKRNLRSLQAQSTGENDASNNNGNSNGNDDGNGDDDDDYAEFLAEMIPTIAFLEPFQEQQKRTKPSNENVRALFGGWMDFLFGIQRDIYLRTLVGHPTQELLQEITKLKVDVDVDVNVDVPIDTGTSSNTNTNANTNRQPGTSTGTPPMASAASSNDSNNKNMYKEDWSDRTKNALITMLVVLACIALVWPLYAWNEGIKRDREIKLQLLHHGGESLQSSDGYGDGYNDDLSSVTYRDDPSHSNNYNNSNCSPLPRPRSLQRTCSLDAARHGSDVFRAPNSNASAAPNHQNITSTASAMAALDASDRYLSRHRPDLFYDQHRSDTNSSVSVFGRSYEIPSNPFEFIYKGYYQNQNQQQQQQQQQQQPPQGNSSSPHFGIGLGRSAHFPFSSPNRSPFRGRSISLSSVGSNSNTSVNANANSASHFAPIQNLAAGGGEHDEDEEERDESGFAASHTGHSWQNHHTHPEQQQDLPTPSMAQPNGGGAGSLMGNIFRNLSMSTWYSSGNANNGNGNSNGNGNNYDYNNHYNSNPDYRPSYSGGEEEVYYDDYDNNNDSHYLSQYEDPTLYGREIEMESLPYVENDDPSNYKFAFQDFPRKDGTPCLIVDDDTLLNERQRRESAKMIFTIGSDGDDDDDGSLTERKLDDRTQVSDDAFKRMLSQNSSNIDGSSLADKRSLSIDDGDTGSITLPPLESSFLSSDNPPDAKSQEFQDKLSRFISIKIAHYENETKNAAIVAEKKKKRKNVRERERVDRHKAIERELEDIEAEFSLTVQPRSPMRNKNKNNNGSGSGNLIGTPGRNNNGSGSGNVIGTPGRSKELSPKPTGVGARFSPMPSRYNVSPGNHSIVTHSPGRAILGRGSDHAHMRTNSYNSVGGDHRRRNSFGTSPFRQCSPRARHPQHTKNKSSSSGIGNGNGEIFRQEGAAGSGDRVSPPDGLANLDAPTDLYKVKFRPVNLHGSDRFSGSQGGHGHGTSPLDALSLPSMTTVGGAGQLQQQHDAKFPSPQAVIDEVMQIGQDPVSKAHHLSNSMRAHRRSRTPTNISSSSRSSLSTQQSQMHRRVNTFDDESYQHRSIRQTGSFGTSPAQQLSSSTHNHRRTVSSSVTTTRKRSNSQHSVGSTSGHRRTGSNSDDVFLHGVVAKTRFV